MDSVKIEIGPFTLTLDAEDLKRVENMSWTVVTNGELRFLSRVNETGKAKRITLARFLMNPPPRDVVVRREGTDPLDYRKSCFEIVSMAQRQAGLGKRSGVRSSRFKGVCLCKRTGLWRASIRPGGLSIFLGDHESEIVAAKAYNEAALKYYGPRAFLNTFESEDEDI